MNLFRRRSVPDRPLSCRQVGRVLQDYLDSELDEVATDRVAEHLEDCRRCGMSADVYLEIKASLGRDAPVVAEDALERLQDFSRNLVHPGNPDGPDPA